MTAEQAEILGWFTTMLQDSSADGGRKRAAGLKPSWKIDPAHEAAIFSHLNKWKHGEKVDAESGAHPLVHLAWRALAIAWQETHSAANDGVHAHPIDSQFQDAVKALKEVRVAGTDRTALVPNDEADDIELGAPLLCGYGTCGAIYTSPEALRHHRLVEVHPVDGKTIPCGYTGCLKECFDVTHRQVHRLNAHGIGNTKAAA